MNKKIITILSFYLLTFLLGMTANAADNAVKIDAAGCFAKENEQVTVNYNLTSNSGFAGFSAEISYDKDILTFESAAPSAILTGGNFYCKEKSEGKLSVVWSDSSDRTINTKLMSLNFKVKNGTADMTAPITNSINMGNVELENVSVAMAVPTIRVTGETKLGDTNRDGKTELSDLVMLCRYISNPSGVHMSNTALANGDIFQSGDITNSDALALLKLVAGGAV